MSDTLPAAKQIVLEQLICSSFDVLVGAGELQLCVQPVLEKGQQKTESGNALANVAFAPPIGKVAHDLVEKCKLLGVVNDLVVALAEARPRRTDWQEYLKVLGLSSTVSTNPEVWQGLAQEVRRDQDDFIVPLSPPDGRPRTRIIVGAALGICILAVLLAFFAGQNWRPVPTSFEVVKFGGVPVEFVKVPAGSCMMGAIDSDTLASENERPRHRISFTEPLWVGKHPVTLEQFRAFINATGYLTDAENSKQPRLGFGGWGGPEEQGLGYCWHNPGIGFPQGPHHPVINVSWDDASRFANWATTELKIDGYCVRLLSESEYEYSSRAGKDHIYISGDKPESLLGCANVQDISRQSARNARAHVLDDKLTVPIIDGHVYTSAVGQFSPNSFGLYDMTGNVYSWCADTFQTGLYARRQPEVTNPPIEIGDGQKSIRGGAWDCYKDRCRISFRSGADTNSFTPWIGFRICIARTSPKK